MKQAENQNEWFTFSDETKRKERAKEFDRVFADLYEKLNIKPILETNE